VATQGRQRTLEATELTLVPRLQGLISDMDRVIGMPTHEVVVEVGIHACFAGAALHRAFPFLVHAGPVDDAGPGLMCDQELNASGSSGSTTHGSPWILSM